MKRLHRTHWPTALLLTFSLATCFAAYDFPFGEYLIERKYFDLATKHYQKCLARSGPNEARKMQSQLGLRMAEIGDLAERVESGQIPEDQRAQIAKKFDGVLKALEEMVQTGLSIAGTGRPKKELSRDKREILQITGRAEYEMANAYYAFAKFCPEKDPARAEKLTKAISLYSLFDSPYGYLGRALCYVEQKNYQKAVTDFDKVTRWPDGPLDIRVKAHLHKAKAYLGKRDFRGAIDAIEELSKLTRAAGFQVPDEADRIRATALTSLGKPLESLDIFIERGLYDKALGILLDMLVEGKLTRDPGQAAGCYYKLGICNYNAKNRNCLAAAKAFEKVATQYPSSNYARKAAYFCAVAYGECHRSNPSAAMAAVYHEALARLLKQFPKHENAGSVHYLIARSFEGRGELDSALEHFQRVPKECKHYADSRFRIAFIHVRRFQALATEGQGGSARAKKEFSLAEAALKPIIESSQSSADASPAERAAKLATAANATIALARLKANSVIGHYDEALGLLETFHRAYPESKALLPEVALLQLICYQGQGEPAKAAKKLEELHRSFPDSTQLAQAFMLMGDEFKKKAASSQETVEALHRSLERDSRPSAFIAVGNKLYSLGRYQDAARVYDRFLAKFSRGQAEEKEVLATKYRLSQCYIELQEWQKALPFCQELEKANPEHALFKKALAGCYEGVGKYGEALKLWTILDKRTAEDTTEWFAARYHVALMHFRLKRAAKAKSLLALTRELYPELGGEESQARFKRLEDQCGSASPEGAGAPKK